MSKIKLLSKSLSQKIAAGEVVERPASVVKELVENSLDAGGTFITVEIEDGGKKLIRVSDNGIGIAPDELELAFLRHATSKIDAEEDLYNISCMGFRGEALYSISAVSKTTMLTKTMVSEIGKKAVIEGGEIIEISDTGCPTGTTVAVKDLFYNTPARLKFMKSTSAETAQISSIVQKMILAKPEVSIKLISNGKLIYQSSGDGSLKSAVNAVYGANIATSLKEFSFNQNGIVISGVLGDRATFRSSRINQTLYVNQRYVKDNMLSQVVESAYGSLLMKGKYPFFIIFIETETSNVDVNVHPQKLFVKFSNTNDIKQALYTGVKSVAIEFGGKPDLLFNEEDTAKSKSPVRQTFEFERRETDINQAANIDILKKDTEQDDKLRLDKSFKEYNYKDELAYHKSINEPAKFKQKTTVYDVSKNQADEQKTYLDENLSSNIIGVAFNTYIIVEHEDVLYLIDQHAAHERLIYEKLMEQYLKSTIISQKLLIPQECSVTYEEKTLLLENINLFKKVGYEIEPGENLSVSILAVPHILGQPRYSSFFTELFDLFIADGDKDELSIVKKIISMSCKKAVKAGDKLSNEEISLLLKAIKDEDIPLTCPHGRPFVMSVDKSQIDKKAGRIN